MTIICGTDFSESAAAAARIAAAIAKRLEHPLDLVHVAAGSRVDEAVRARLEADAEQLRAELAVDVECLIEAGAADERLVELASSLETPLVVVGALGGRKQHRWLLGSVAERVAQSSSVPVLVARDGGAIEAWARGEGALRMVVGVERTPASRAALRWAEGLCAIGPCELVIAQIVWPAEEHQRAGLATPIPLDHLRPELEQALLRELKQWVGESAAAAGVSCIVKPGWGRVHNHLSQLAVEAEADLVVVGTHQRAGVARLWQGSVSRGVLHDAAMSVVCVPSSTAALRELDT